MYIYFSPLSCICTVTHGLTHPNFLVIEFTPDSASARKKECLPDSKQASAKFSIKYINVGNEFDKLFKQVYEIANS